MIANIPRMILNGNIDFEKIKKMRDTRIDDWFAKSNMILDLDLDIEWKRLNQIDWNDNDLDLDLDNIDLTKDHLDIGHDFNRMIELEFGGTYVSQHEHALRKICRMRVSRITDWIDKDRSMVNMEMKPLGMNNCSIDPKGLESDAVIEMTKCSFLQPVANVDVSPPIEQIVNTECGSELETKVVIKPGLGEFESGREFKVDLDKRDMYPDMVPKTDIDKIDFDSDKRDMYPNMAPEMDMDKQTKLGTKQVKIGNGFSLDNEDQDLDIASTIPSPYRPSIFHSPSIIPQVKRRLDLINKSGTELGETP